MLALDIDTDSRKADTLLLNSCTRDTRFVSSGITFTLSLKAEELFKKLLKCENKRKITKTPNTVSTGCW